MDKKIMWKLNMLTEKQTNNDILFSTVCFYSVWTFNIGNVAVWMMVNKKQRAASLVSIFMYPIYMYGSVW